jgi:SPP1 gp7 family putative phage head morphogenesis protein
MNWNDVKEIGNILLGKNITAKAGALPKLSKEDVSIISQLAQEFKDRTRKDVQAQKDAKASIDNTTTPRWAPMMDLYDYLKPDGHYGSQVGLRTAATRCTPFLVKDKSGKIKPDMTAALKEAWFFKSLADIIEAELYKSTVLQFPNWKQGDMNYIKIPRRNYVPGRRVILKEVYGDVCYSIDDPVWADTFVVAESQSDYGIMDDIVKDLIWKKNSRESWAEFSEKFGIPLITATVVTRDKKEIARIMAMLNAMGEAAKAVLPKGSDITVHDSAAKGDPYMVYSESVKLSNSEISKRIVGGTMISDSGSSYNQSKTHEAGFLMICQEDQTNAQFIISKQILPKIKGYSDGDVFEFDRTEKLTLKELWEIINGMLTQGADIEPKWIAERFNIPVTAFNKPQEVNFNKAPAAMAIAAGANGIVWPMYNTISCSKCKDHLPVSSWKEIPELARLSETILQYLWAGKETRDLQIEKAILTGGVLRDGLFDGWSNRMQIDYNAVDHRALAAMEYNLFHFSCTREKAGVFALNDLLLNKEKLKITGYKEFQDAAQPMLKNMNVNWLRTEYNFCTAVGQTSSRYNQFINEKDSVTSFWQYQTVGDDHVRPQHEVLNLRIFSFDDASARALWPPNDWDCRCEGNQYLGSTKGKVTSGADGTKLINWTGKQKKDFGFNRADIGEVFTANQQYINDKGIADNINSMDFTKYGLDPVSTIAKTKKALAIDDTITPENVKDLFKKVKGEKYAGYEDYLQRKIILNETDFKTHTTGKYVKGNERRHKIFPAVKDVLLKPDEVYMNNYKDKKFQSTYVKHYKNTSIAVATELGSNNLQVMTWYEINKEEQVRKGLLIHKNK